MSQAGRQVFERALNRHQAGRWQEADQLYRQVLKTDPRNADALHLLGLLSHQQGQNEAAVEWISKAIRVNPRVADFHNNHGVVLAALGRFAEAAEAYRRVIKLQPERVDGYFNLGVTLQRLGQLADAERCYEDCLKRKKDAGAFCNLGLIRLSAGQMEQARACFEHALQVDAEHPDATLNLAVALKETGRLEEAVTQFQRSLKLQPGNPNAVFGLAATFHDLKRFEEAEQLYRRVIEAQPRPEACNNLATILEERDQLGEAEGLYRQAIQMSPDSAMAFGNLGNILSKQGRSSEALEMYGKAIDLEPDYAEPRLFRSYAWLVQGNFEVGWREFEWRWKWKGFTTPKPAFVQPAWDGRPLEGRTILIYCEQGLGDCIQFIRYADLVSQRGGRVLISCPPELCELFQCLKGTAEILPPGRPLPRFDTHVALMSLPYVLGTRLETVPAGVPYFSQPEASLCPLPGSASGTKKVGIVWAGGTKYSRHHWRTASLENWLSLLRTPHCTFYSLQAGERAADLQSLPADVKVHDVGSQLKTWKETASVLGQLDLLISTCTSVPHLAGALGRPVWLLLARSACWRWLEDREDTPWYPSMRLFRQQQLGDWDPVFAEVGQQLAP